MRHSGRPSCNAARKSRADVYVRTSSPRTRNSRASAFSTEASSSTIATQGEVSAMCGTFELVPPAVELDKRPIGPHGHLGLALNLDAGLLGQSHQVCDRAQTQFLHHPAAVDLDGLLDRPQVAGDLLVELAGDDMCQNLALARRQGRHPS